MVNEPPHQYRNHLFRLRGYDYSLAGAYFVTICVHERCLLFEPEPVREMIERWWLALETKYAVVVTDAFVVMPNHVHGIVAIVDDDHHEPAYEKVALPTIMQWFKTMTTNEYMRGVHQNGWEPFHGHLWQRSYWDHVVRNEVDMARLREYITSNPSRWMKDSLHP